MGPNHNGSVDEQRLAVEFLASAPSLAQCPAPQGAEVAFAGRSNAGKSSVLNRLTGNRNTAKVSKTPGRTQMLNFFDVSEGGRLVDLPGYGYAKAEKRAQQRWQRNVNDYLSHRDALSAVVLVTDIRHPGALLDIELLEWAAASELPVLLLLNKADKVKRGARMRALQDAVQANADLPLVQVSLFSAHSGLGTDSVIATLRQWLGHRG